MAQPPNTLRFPGELRKQMYREILSETNPKHSRATLQGVSKDFTNELFNEARLIIKKFCEDFNTTNQFGLEAKVELEASAKGIMEGPDVIVYVPISVLPLAGDEALSVDVFEDTLTDLELAFQSFCQGLPYYTRSLTVTLKSDSEEKIECISRLEPIFRIVENRAWHMLDLRMDRGDRLARGDMVDLWVDKGDHLAWIDVEWGIVLTQSAAINAVNFMCSSFDNLRNDQLERKGPPTSPFGIKLKRV